MGCFLVHWFNPPPKDGQAAPKKCTDECCGGAENKRIARGLKFAFVTLPRDIGGAMLVGLVIAAFISVLVPDDFFAEKLGTGIFAMLVMMALGIPMYVCATASVPIAAVINSGRAPHPGWMLRAVVKNISAVILLAVLAFALLTKKKQAK